MPLHRSVRLERLEFFQDRVHPMRARLAIPLALMILNGCGSANVGITTSAASTRQQFVAQANAICAHADEKASALTSGGKLKPKSLGAATTLLRETETELRKLTPPPPLAAGFRRFLTLAAAEIKVVSALANAIQNRNLQAARTLAGELSSNISNQAAADIGLTTCAKQTG